MKKQSTAKAKKTSNTKKQPKTTANKTPAKKAAAKPTTTAQKKSNGKTTQSKTTARSKTVATTVKTPAATKSTPPTSSKATDGLVTIEIRRHNDAKGGHPHIMVDILGDKNVSVGITHDKKKGKNHPNISLEHNPLGEKKQAYMHREGTVDKKENYSSTKRTGQLTTTDNEKAKQIGEKAKQKELSKKKSKK